MKKPLLIITIITFLLNCSDIPEDTEYQDYQKDPTSLNDSRFNDDFSYSYSWIDNDGIDEKTEYTSYNFDGTNKIYYYHSYSSYSPSSGWSYSGDYIDDYYSWYYEAKIEGDYISFILWNNSYAEWSDPIRFEFSADGNTLTFFDEAMYEDDLVLTN